MNDLIEPTVDDDRRYRMEIIGEYVEQRSEIYYDRERSPIAVEPGRYPVVGAVALDGKQLHEGGIIFSGVDTTTGEPKTLVQFHSAGELRELNRSGKLELEAGRDRSLLDDRAVKLQPAGDRGQRSSEKPRQAMRR